MHNNMDNAYILNNEMLLLPICSQEQSLLADLRAVVARALSGLDMFSAPGEPGAANGASVGSLASPTAVALNRLSHGTSADYASHLAVESPVGDSGGGDRGSGGSAGSAATHAVRRAAVAAALGRTSLEAASADQAARAASVEGGSSPSSAARRPTVVEGLFKGLGGGPAGGRAASR